MATPATPAARLREAAEVVREASAKATKGPWFAEDPNVRWGDDYDHRLVGGGKTLGTLDTEHNGPLNLEWIALMHPGVGEPLAAVMETAATYLGDEPQVAYPSHVVAALALADAILAAVTR